MQARTSAFTPALIGDLKLKLKQRQGEDVKQQQEIQRDRRNSFAFVQGQRNSFAGKNSFAGINSFAGVQSRRDKETLEETKQDLAATQLQLAFVLEDIHDTKVQLHDTRAQLEEFKKKFDTVLLHLQDNQYFVQHKANNNREIQ